MELIHNSQNTQQVCCIINTTSLIINLQRVMSRNSKHRFEVWAHLWLSHEDRDRIRSPITLIAVRQRSRNQSTVTDKAIYW